MSQAAEVNGHREVDGTHDTLAADPEASEGSAGGCLQLQQLTCTSRVLTISTKGRTCGSRVASKEGTKTVVMLCS